MKNLIAILAIALVLVSCHEESHTSHHQETSKLETTNPILVDTTVTREYVCQIHASKHIELRALEKGYLQDIFVDEGQKVSKGQRMFKIMPNIYEADLLKMKAEAEVVQIEYNNTKMLADQKVVSPNELALAKAQLDKAHAEVLLAETHLNFTNIQAPFSGIMDHLHVREGSLLDEGELLTTLSDNSKMWVYFNMPEVEYLDYMTTPDADKNKQVNLRLANGRIFGQEGRIETIEAEFNHETGNIEFRATFPNPNGILRHGETGNILMNSVLQNALIIPQKATFEVLDKVYVFVINAENKLEQRPITISHELPHLFVVKSGLTTSDKILIEGLRKVNNGDEIEEEFISPSVVYSDLDFHAE